MILRALVATWLIDVPHEESESLRNSLLDVRDTLHEASGRKGRPAGRRADPRGRSSCSTWAPRSSTCTRASSVAASRTCRRWPGAASIAPSPPTRKPKISPTGPVVTRLAEGVGLLDGEVIVMQRADPATDPEVALRAAAAAARDGLSAERGVGEPAGRDDGRDARSVAEVVDPADGRPADGRARVSSRSGTSSTSPA